MFSTHMINSPSARLLYALRLPFSPSSHHVFIPVTPLTRRCLSATSYLNNVSNRVYPAVRDPDTLSTLLLSSASNRTSLITLWTASWCPTCRQVLPLIRSLVEKERVGEAQGGVGFVEVEYDAPGNEESGMRYMINSVPTLLAFARQEAQVHTKVVKAKQLSDADFLRAWIEDEARRGAEGGRGGKGILGALFGGKGE